MDKETSEVLGKLVDKLPGHSIKRAGNVVITSFEKCISPLTNWLGGWGELIKLRFEAKAEHEKRLIAETYESAREKIEASTRTPTECQNINVHIAIMDYSPLETDVIKRDLLSNILANEEINADVHPEIVRILSYVTTEEIKALTVIKKFQERAKIAKTSLSSGGVVDTPFSREIRTYVRKHLFSLAVLRKYHLIEYTERGRNFPRLSAIGNEFVRCISVPQLEARTNKKGKRSQNTMEKDG